MLMSRDPTLPTRLFLVRHAESAGNVARQNAEAAGLPMIEITGRDVDVPLSELGREQARALGRWFAAQPDSERPTVVLASPYVRASETARIVVEHLPEKPPITVDERLREKEFGSFNRLTKAGILQKFPHDAAARAELGKFYYRPPGGESWCDVVLRVRSALQHIELGHRRERVLVVAHQVIVLCCRYVIEGLDEAQLLAIDRQADVANCSVTSYELEQANDRERLALRRYNYVSALEQAGAPVTEEPDPKP
jgi:broad specificity phosphatase PhoE